MSAAQLPSSLRQQLSKALDGFVKASPQASSTSSGTSPRLSIVYQSQPSWPFSSHHARTSSSSPVDVAVLDSSFNPPHLAHLALASSPPLLSSAKQQQRHYGAHLLLLSSRNADKGTGKTGDASTLQRLEMMVVLAKDLEAKLAADNAAASSGSDDFDVKEPNVAVGICEEPLMKDKSTIVHEWLHTFHQSIPSRSARLHWVVGWDTLIRFFALKYYPSLHAFEEACQRFFVEEGTTFVCARRDVAAQARARGEEATEGGDQDEENRFLQSDLVKPWVEHKSVAMFDLPVEARHVNSTDIRNICRDDKEGEKAKKLVEKKLCTEALASFVVDEGIYQ